MCQQRVCPCERCVLVILYFARVIDMKQREQNTANNGQEPHQQQRAKQKSALCLLCFPPPPPPECVIIFAKILYHFNGIFRNDISLSDTRSSLGPVCLLARMRARERACVSVLVPNPFDHLSGAHMRILTSITLHLTNVSLTLLCAKVVVCPATGPPAAATGAAGPPQPHPLPHRAGGGGGK